ncbi:MAG: hemerythrin domain-containing protein [Phenylobacterium sp.]|jgi:hemerythrin superfamily protein|uniref:hemerythrin domain-containing protein n=1 Tax=Phenylobacterium sp. TaxID=1871053 RepID=UPI00391C16BA
MPSLRLVTGAALGLVAGLAIPHARKAMMQAPSALAGDWLDALVAEHRLVQAAFEKLLATGEDQAHQREMLLSKIAYALTKHGVEEENVVYPALSETSHAAEARHLTEDHAAIKTFIYDLRRMPAGDPSWLVRAREFSDHVDTHIREEEEEIFPVFRDALSVEENAKLTRMLNWEGFKVA